MQPRFKNSKSVPYTLFRKGAVRTLGDVLKERGVDDGYHVYIIDRFFENRELISNLPIRGEDRVIFYDASDEPKTRQVDQHVSEIMADRTDLPSVLIGIGGGSTLDVTKAVSILLTNPGSATQYQGWDLVKEKPIFKIGIPTLSGTGTEVSRTCVLSGPEKKQGINSIFSLFEQIILDPELLSTVPREQAFFTGMDCYIHCAESLSGSYINAFGRAFAEKGLELCEKFFLGEPGDRQDEDLMVASYMGGYSIVYSEVGVCHALSYGISYVFGYHHGEANCIVFDQLEEFYPRHVPVFREMLKRNRIKLPQGITKGLDPERLEKMVELTLLMERPLHNALGDHWRDILAPARIRELYLKY